MRSSEPPKLALKFLSWYCKPEMLEDLEGALYEYYHERIDQGKKRTANWMFFLDVLMHFRPHTIKRKSQNSNIMFKSHIKVSLRNIRKYKLSSVLNALGLSSGLACFILIMLWVNKELSFDNFHENGDRIYRVVNTFRSESETFSQAISGPALGGRLHEEFAEIEHATRFYGTSERIKVNNQYFYQSDIALADQNFLTMFDFAWIAGDQNTALMEPLSMVLTESTAVKLFGDKNPIGEVVAMDGLDMNITGIIADPPENSQIQFNALIPTIAVRDLWGIENINERWGGGWFYTYIQVKRGTDASLLEKDITSFIGEKLTDWAEQGMYYDYILQPLQEIHLTSNLRYDYANGSISNVRIFIAAAIVILLLACINYINLATANAMVRSKEVGMRKVIGAPRSQLITQYLVESLMMVLISVAIAGIIITLLLPMFSQLTGYENIELLTLENIAFLMILVFALSLLAGSLPAYLISKINVLKVIKGNLKSGTQFNLLRKGLVVTQFTATIILLISILVINDQMAFIQKSDIGMKTSGIVHINFRGAQEVRDKIPVVREELLKIPAVENVSFLRNSYPVYGLSNSGTLVETGTGERVQSSIYTLRVDQDFEKTFGLSLVSGRFYSKDFPSDTTESIVVNEACIANFGWKDAEDALGKRFGEGESERKVIGVVRNFNFEALHRQIEPVRILPIWTNRFSTVAVKAQFDDPSTLVKSIDEMWMSLNPTVPLDLSFMDDDLKQQYVQDYNFKSVFTVFSIISIIIGCLGLFGLATANANRRLREVSIRKVLGASVTEIVSLINKEFIYLILLSALLASPVAYYLMNKWLDNFSYHISFRWEFILLALLGALVLTIVTVSIKAFKTAFTNPASILKDE